MVPADSHQGHSALFWKYLPAPPDDRKEEEAWGNSLSCGNNTPCKQQPSRNRVEDKNLFTIVTKQINVCVLSRSVVSDSCDPIDYSLPGSFVHGISQARILERVATSFSRGSSWRRNRTRVSCISSRLFPDWTTRMSRNQLNKGCVVPILWEF